MAHTLHFLKISWDILKYLCRKLHETNIWILKYLNRKLYETNICLDDCLNFSKLFSILSESITFSWIYKYHLWLERSLNKFISVDKTTSADVQLFQNSPKVGITFQTKKANQTCRQCIFTTWPVFCCLQALPIPFEEGWSTP